MYRTIFIIIVGLTAIGGCGNQNQGKLRAVGPDWNDCQPPLGRYCETHYPHEPARKVRVCACVDEATVGRWQSLANLEFDADRKGPHFLNDDGSLARTAADVSVEIPEGKVTVPVSFDILAAELRNSIAQVGRQAHITVLYDWEEVPHDIEAPPVIGTYTPEEAIRILLERTPELGYTIAAPTVIIVRSHQGLLRRHDDPYVEFGRELPDFRGLQKAAVERVQP